MSDAGAQRPELLRAAFDKFDSDGNGFIDEVEFSDLVASLGIGMTAEKVQIAFTAIDVNGNGHIDFGEFAEWWGRRAAP
jgi:Ca2+-binding EF-hand superfamily protein